MDKEVEMFKTDYTIIKERVKQIKQKLRDLKKEIRPTANLAYRLYMLGDKTMYDEGKGRAVTPKTKSIPAMMENLESWMDLDEEIQHVIECFC